MSTFEVADSTLKVVGRKEVRGRSGRLWNYLSIILLLVMGFIMIMPFVWLVSSSLKSQIDIFSYPPKWIPNSIHWENYVNALTIYLRSPQNFTIAVGLSSFRSTLDVSWNLQLAATTAVILLVVVLFFFTQRYFIKGIVMTGMKG